MKHLVQSDCDCDSHKALQDLVSVEEATQIALHLTTSVPGSELVQISEAIGRVTSKPLYAPTGMPFFNNSAMDGYAISLASLVSDGPWELMVGSTIAAGDIADFPEGTHSPNQAVRIFTGAPVPDGFDSVVPQENCTVENGIVSLKTKPKLGANIRYAGSDIERGSVLIEAGTIIAARHIGLLAANGYGAINVKRQIKIAIFSTGDELITAGEPITSGQIYDCNKPMLVALLSEMGFEVDDLGSLPDDQLATQKMMEKCRSGYDYVLSTGSVSVGERDYLKSAFLQAGGDIGNWKVAVKPGKPVLFGRLGEAVFTGLPGNPFAAYVGFHLFVKPQLRKMSGAAEFAQSPVTAIADFNWQRKSGRAEFFPVELNGKSDAGLPKLRRLGNSVSATLFPLMSADGLAQVPAECAEIKCGDAIQWQAFCY